MIQVVIGTLLILFVVGILFVLTCEIVGLKISCAIWGSSIMMTIIIILGAYLITNGLK